MKTTLEIADPLLKEAKAVAARDNLTLRTLVEEGLRAVLARKRGGGRPFRLRDASFKGRGLHREFAARGGWANLREAAYDGERGV